MAGGSKTKPRKEGNEVSKNLIFYLGQICELHALH